MRQLDAGSTPRGLLPLSAVLPQARGSVTAELLRRYDRPGPRYTSYPTAVEFHEGLRSREYAGKLEAAAAHPDEPLSLYTHLPFCQERCSFCGCYVVITRKPEVSARYLQYLERELAMLAEHLGERRRVVQLHWGGGTPTYLTIDQMSALFAATTRHFSIDPHAEVAIEVDPRVTTHEQIDWLRAAGFNRLSMGVQDFTPVVQDAIHRIQGEDATRALFDHARLSGYESINVDLIYGLPHQTIASFGKTLDSVVSMRPDRVAVYSYAHVPWIRGNQKRIDPADLPPREIKFELFGQAIDRFLGAGYIQIGMDNFALPSDDLAVAAQNRGLHRNFMGYTTRPATDMFGIGVSAIGDVRGAFIQNAKKLSTYYATLDNGQFPVERGYVLDADDRIRAHVITQLMCNFHVERARVGATFGISFDDYFALELAELAADEGPAAHGLVELHPDSLHVPAKGRLFVRNLCMVFDRYLRTKKAEGPVFSRTI
jgi:oxygen-independent coproporphyrinogen-3 oxidase